VRPPLRDQERWVSYPRGGRAGRVRDHLRREGTSGEECPARRAEGARGLARRTSEGERVNDAGATKATVATRTILTPTGGFLLGFTHTLNPYRGCAFGRALCGVYCYASETRYGE